jgi:hypothetical protein
MSSDATKLLVGFYGRPRQNILSPDNIDPGRAHHARTDCGGSSEGGGRGLLGSTLVAISIAPATLIVGKTPCVLVNERSISRAREGLQIA